PQLDIHDVTAFLTHLFERIDLERDLHFHTQTTIDTLDYTGDGLNAGSKVVFAAVGGKKRELATELPGGFALPQPFQTCKLALPGIVAVEAPAFIDEATEGSRIETWCHEVRDVDFGGIHVLVLCGDAAFTAANADNFVWITFTRSNP